VLALDDDEFLLAVELEVDTAVGEVASFAGAGVLDAVALSAKCSATMCSKAPQVTRLSASS